MVRVPQRSDRERSFARQPDRRGIPIPKPGELRHRPATTGTLARGFRLASIIQSRLRVERHTAALVLKRSLLPTLVSRREGLDIPARYIPAEGDLGGDWYDVLDLRGERVGILMGDVVGHGLEAAVVMGRLRTALRAYALEHDDPAEVLSRLDTKISYSRSVRWPPSCTAWHLHPTHRSG
jgi:stage II sporulation SpoE-like protein